MRQQSPCGPELHVDWNIDLHVGCLTESAKSCQVTDTYRSVCVQLNDSFYEQSRQRMLSSSRTFDMDIMSIATLSVTLSVAKAIVKYVTVCDRK